MSKPVVEFFYDIASPYAWLAAERIDALAENAGTTTQWRPFLLGAVFAETGNKMPASVRAKGAWMGKDLAMNASRWGLDFSFPSAFPIKTVAHLRALLHVDREHGQEAQARLALAWYRAYWGEGRDVSDPDVMAEVAVAAGFDTADLIAAYSLPENKQALVDNTAEAVRRGAFGAPTFFVGDTMFWGHDRLDMLAWFLSERA